MSDYLRKPDQLDENKATNLQRFVKCFDNFIGASDAANKNEKQKCYFSQSCRRRSYRSS